MDCKKQPMLRYIQTQLSQDYLYIWERCGLYMICNIMVYGMIFFLYNLEQIQWYSNQMCENIDYYTSKIENSQTGYCKIQL